MWAQQIKEIRVLPGEKWWAGVTGQGYLMPFSETARKIDLRTQNFNNQTCPILVSSKGRYIWSDAPFSFEFKEGVIYMEPTRAEITCTEAGKTLRDAYLAASGTHFPPSGELPAELFFSKPQYNTWIELIYDQNQADVLAYAQGILDNGFPPGVLMIDDNWQKYYGNFEFRPDRFPDPKGLMDQLHAMGFKVMLWISPFVSPDTQEYRELRDKGYLVKEKGSNRPAILDWWNGLSACYDLSNPAAFDHYVSILKKMQADYGVDGFKLDAGDPERYLQENVDVFDHTSFDTEQTYLWAKLGLQFPYNEYRACWKLGGQALVQRLGDKKYSWDAVSWLVPDMIAAGLQGYAYACPDMIGGGEFSSFQGVDPSNIDQKLMVRSCQIHSMMPMMQFSVAPWRVLDKEHLDICIKYAKWHEELGDYILTQARHASQTGEPVVRHMEYSFPGQGFEECIDQFMLGDKYLVAPVMTPEDTRTVQLPKGTWRDDTGKQYKGGKTYTLHVPIDRLPWFVQVK
ncbi:MAG: glycoside hydrolase family 31 protein [Tannerellaceae bacterium]|nr:glycoside hydrolase family 31 protein [Tannerellaceae bacterium]